MSIYDKKLGIILGGVCGDILGSQTEGKTRESIYLQYKDGLVRNLPERKEYTDDSEMTLVLLRHLVNNNTVNTQKLHIEFGSVDFKREYSNDTRRILQEIKQNKNFKVYPIGVANTNDAIMRISPLAISNIHDKELKTEVLKSIYYTHGGSPDAHSTAYFHCKLLRTIVGGEYNKDKILLLEYILRKTECHPPLWVKLNIVYRCITSTKPVESITKELTGNMNTFQSNAIDTFCCALYSFILHYSNPCMAMIYAASMGGDTDTIGKITGELCGALHGISWIPKEWLGFENQDEFISLVQSFIDSSK